MNWQSQKYTNILQHYEQVIDIGRLYLIPLSSILASLAFILAIFAKNEFVAVLTLTIWIFNIGILSYVLATTSKNHVYIRSTIAVSLILQYFQLKYFGRFVFINEPIHVRALWYLSYYEQHHRIPLIELHSTSSLGYLIAHILAEILTFNSFLTIKVLDIFGTILTALILTYVAIKMLETKVKNTITHVSMAISIAYVLSHLFNYEMNLSFLPYILLLHILYKFFCMQHKEKLTVSTKNVVVLIALLSMATTFYSLSNSIIIALIFLTYSMVYVIKDRNSNNYIVIILLVPVLIFLSRLIIDTIFLMYLTKQTITIKSFTIQLTEGIEIKLKPLGTTEPIKATEYYIMNSYLRKLSISAFIIINIALLFKAFSIIASRCYPILYKQISSIYIVFMIFSSSLYIPMLTGRYTYIADAPLIIYSRSLSTLVPLLLPLILPSKNSLHTKYLKLISSTLIFLILISPIHVLYLVGGGSFTSYEASYKTEYITLPYVLKFLVPYYSSTISVIMTPSQLLGSNLQGLASMMDHNNIVIKLLPYEETLKRVNFTSYDKLFDNHVWAMFMDNNNKLYVFWLK